MIHRIFAFTENKVLFKIYTSKLFGTGNLNFMDQNDSCSQNPPFYLIVVILPFYNLFAWSFLKYV